MTDPEMADRTYIEPITPEIIEQSWPSRSRMRSCPRSGGRRG